MKRALPLGLGVLALVTTIALICDGIVLAVQTTKGSSVWATSIIATILEAIVLSMLAWFVLTTCSQALATLLRRSSPRRLAASFTLAGIACLFASAMVIATIVCLSNEPGAVGPHRSSQAQLGATATILAVAVACQLGFLAAHYFLCRRTDNQDDAAAHNDAELRSSPTSRLKSVPYSRTRPSLAKNQETDSKSSMESGFTEELKAGYQGVSSPRPSLSPSLHHASSKTKLAPLPEKQRPQSLETVRQRPSADGSDKSSLYSRHTQDLPSPGLVKPRLLETIPASPTVANDPAMSLAADLEPPPPIMQRSRSFSPVGEERRSRQRTQSPAPSAEEANIHPLFRSDSPTPPPLASSGTSVVASPDAGKIIPHRPSMQSMRRLRSSSSASTLSPLSRRNSLEAPSIKKPRDEQGSILEVDEESAADTDVEILPPIPDFVMGAGNRHSLTRYNSKKSEHEQS
ncbi:uncharacterized protein J7T54_002442 [Emericellopsis cladophorae]|uniref:Uncharacterized protein n=1 Tax=Emericellopsis cladophorae TaxID=2686198 RepID=A0A9P9Y340_9HYPO|nr:uncharacterized protein J7T54_002442 [Emericellopsis cladophorae]KAI6782205.1 hypothetical protein J7T54_002442 [Emericellopsis cladophorae]